MDVNKQNLIAFAKDLKQKGKGKLTIESYTKDAESFLSFLQERSYKLSEAEPYFLSDYQDYLRRNKKGKYRVKWN